MSLDLCVCVCVIGNVSEFLCVFVVLVSVVLCSYLYMLQYNNVYVSFSR